MRESFLLPRKLTHPKILLCTAIPALLPSSWTRLCQQGAEAATGMLQTPQGRPPSSHPRRHHRDTPACPAGTSGHIRKGSRRKRELRGALTTRPWSHLQHRPAYGGGAGEGCPGLPGHTSAPRSANLQPRGLGVSQKWVGAAHFLQRVLVPVTAASEKPHDFPSSLVLLFGQQTAPAKKQEDCPVMRVREGFPRGRHPPQGLAGAAFWDQQGRRAARELSLNPTERERE